MDQDDMLAFLFMLGSLELGQDYSTGHLTQTQQMMLDDLTDFGIVYRPKDSTRFYPTRLATTLTSSDPVSILDDNASVSAQGKGHIILETNHRIYAYTSSPLQVAVLDLFVKLHSRFPNLVSGKLTKDSIQRAISFGITSDQIISYLTANAHPQMQKNNPILPPTVVDQIRLWQIEGDRMNTTPGFLLKEFANAQEYKDTMQYADTLGVLVWKNDTKLCFFVSRIDQIQVYLKNKSAAAAAKRQPG
jgi:transcription initiation factor TFIIH subunit 4